MKPWHSHYYLPAVRSFGAILLWSTALVAPSQLLAQPAATSQPVELAPDPGTVLLPEVQVTAEQELRQAPGVSIITRDEIERMPPVNDVSEIVRQMPGVNLSGNSASGSYGNNRQIDLRGMGPENTLILVDGRPVRSRNSVRMGRTGERNTRGDSNWVPVEAIERIEVLRGPAAARYGSGAAGGVVNIITKQPTDKFGGSLTLYGLQPEDSREGDGRRVGLNLSGPLGNGFSFRTYGSFNRTDADSIDLNREASRGLGLDEAPAGREGVENRDINGLLRWDLAPGQVLELEAGYSRQGNIYAGDRLFGASNGLLERLANRGAETNVLNRYTASLVHRGTWGFGTTRSLLQYEGTHNKRLNEGLVGRAEGTFQDERGFSSSTLNNYLASTEASIPLDLLFSQTVTIGAEFFRENLHDPYSVSQDATGVLLPGVGAGVRDPSNSAELASLYVEDNIEVTDRLRLTPGVRFDHHSDFGSNFSPSLNAAFQITDSLSLRGGVARAFKAPNLYQSNPNYLYYTRGNGCPLAYPSLGLGCYILGNDNLRAETSINKEIGLVYNDAGWNASVTYFHNDYDNKIVAGPAPVTSVRGTGGFGGNIARVFRWENATDAIVEGVEANLLVPLMEELSWNTNFTYQIRSEDTSTGQPLSLIPRYTLNSWLTWRPREDLSLVLSATHYGRQRAPRYSDGGRLASGTELLDRDPYTLVDISGSYHLNESTRLTAGISNLLDKRLFRESSSNSAGANTYNEPGRAYFASLTITF